MNVTKYYTKGPYYKFMYIFDKFHCYSFSIFDKTLFYREQIEIHFP